MKIIKRTVAALKKDNARARKWYKDFGHHTFVSRDFAFAVIAAFGAGVAAGISPDVRAVGSNALVGLAALNVALLAVVLTALAILVALLSTEYVRVLEYAGGVRTAAEPYKTIAVVAGWGILVSLFGSLTWNVLGWVGQASVLALGVCLGVWATWGTVQLVAITAFHGIQRGSLLEGVNEARAKLREIKDAGA